MNQRPGLLYLFKTPQNLPDEHCVLSRLTALCVITPHTPPINPTQAQTEHED